jgi:hypothetical protein
MPSLACFRELASGGKEYRFVLVKPGHIVDSELEAVAEATADFSEACRVDDATGSTEAVGRQLSGQGYVLVEDFEVIGENA